MTRDEVLKTAMKMESDGRQFYLDVAQNAASRQAAEMFRSLADDESRHIEWIRSVAGSVDIAVEYNRALYERLRKVFAEVPSDVKLEAIFSSSEREAINVARRMEEESLKAYTEWQDKVEDDDVKDLLRALATQERLHLQLLDNAEEYLDRTADWFMQEEQWNFD